VGDAAATAAQGAGLAVQTRAERSKTVELLFNARSAPLDDPAVRAALAAAIDRGRIAAAQPGAVAADAPRPGGATAAREALERAGWRDVDKEGTRSKGGQPLRITIVTNDRPERVAAAEELARQLGTVGAKADVQSVGWSGLVGDVLSTGRFQAAVVEAFEPSAVPNPASYWASGAALNLGGWRSQRGDEMLARARSAPTAAARAAVLREWQGVFDAEAPAVPLFHPRITYVVSSELRGQALPQRWVSPRDRFVGVERWYLVTRRAPGRF
jgi:ABC-type transport system substrate-binding protein